MEDINIGDIVTPATPKKREYYGKGIVVRIPKLLKPGYTVIFPREKGSFFAHEFKEDWLVKTTGEVEELRSIYHAEKMYTDILNLNFR